MTDYGIKDHLVQINLGKHHKIWAIGVKGGYNYKQIEVGYKDYKGFVKKYKLKYINENNEWQSMVRILATDWRRWSIFALTFFIHSVIEILKLTDSAV